jgi:PAS domain S-box-containing protein
MNYEFTTLCYVRFLSGLLAIILIVFLWKRRQLRGAVYLLLFELATAIWAIGDGFEAASPTVQMKLHWSQFGYLGVSTSAVMFLLFALSYTGILKLFRLRTILLLMVIPLLTMVMALTNPLHHLLWKEIVVSAGTNYGIYYYGPYFWINIVYEYSALTAGLIILLVSAFKVYSFYKLQFGILIFAALLPFIASISYVFKLTPVKGIDLTPISFILSGTIIAISLFWLRMFNIMPIARRQAIDNLRDGMTVINSAGRIVDANPAFCTITGLQKKDILKAEADNVFSKWNISLDQFSEDNDFTLQIQLGEDTDVQYFEVKCYPIKDNNQKALGKIFLMTDITTKKQILDTIADSNNKRRIEIVEKEKLILDLDAYARSVAHDLKNPISSVVNLTELIKSSLSENNKEEALEMIGMVHDQSERMIRIIDDLLLLSRIRKEDLKIEPVNFGNILGEALFRLHDEISSSDAAVEMPDHWPDVLGHKQWLEEVLINLISNALKYGGRPPAIRLECDNVTESIYRFRISDNGNGLPPDALKKIFMDFERLGRKDIQGNGLGLSIVKRIIEKLGGTVTVESDNKPGRGCIFSFTLKAVPS